MSVSCDKYLVDNLSVIARFEKLEQQNKGPAFGVFRGRSLVIVSYTTSGIWEKACAALHKIAIYILKTIGLVKKDDALVKSLVGRVHSYQYEQVKKHKETELASLETAHKTAGDRREQAITTLKGELQSLESEKTQLTGDLTTLKTSKEEIEGQFDTIRAEYAVAQEVLANKATTEAEVSKLTKEKAILEALIVELKASEEKLLPLKAELDAAKTELINVQAQTSQITGKGKIEELEGIIRNLNQQLAQGKSQYTSLMAQIHRRCVRCGFMV